MEALKAHAKGSSAGSKLIKHLESIPVASEEKEQLAQHILTFAKQQGAAAKPGKENSRAIEGDDYGKVCSFIEGAQLVTPRGKHDLVFYKTLMKVKGKQTIDVPYSSIQNIAIMDSIPKDTKKRVLLFLHLARDSEKKAAKGATSAVVIQVTNGSELDIASPVSDTERLKGQSAIVLCQTFGKLGLASSAFTAPSLDVFSSASGQCAVEAVMGVNQGWLIPLKEAFCFIERPATWIAHSDIASVEFARVGGSASTFDMYIHPNDGSLVEFRNLARLWCREELAGLSSYVTRYGLKIGDGEEEGGGKEARPSGAADSDESDEEDSDFDPDGSESDEEAHAKEHGKQDGEAGSGDAGGSSAEEADSDSDVLVESDEDVPSSKIRQLVQEAKQHQKKKRRLK